MIVYYNGQLLRKSEVCISPDDRGFLFGDGTYEVVRVYHGKVFHFDGHLARLARSLREIHIRLDDLTFLHETSQALIQKNKLQDSDASLYIQITRGIAPRHHRFTEGIAPTVYVTASAVERPLQKLKEGISVHLAPDRRWGRCDIKSIALLANVLASWEAAVQGAHETVFIRDGVLTEGTHTNFCAVFDGAVQTHPADCHILDGITREVVLNLCCELDIPILETPIPADRIPEAEEAFILGTTTEIMPVIRIDQRPVGSGEPGPVTRKLQKAFEEKIRACIGKE
jgi:D-alanine transaminase